MNKVDISEKVIELHKELFWRDKEGIASDYGNENFFGKVMELRPGDVLAFLYAIESNFNITIPPTDLISGRFNCLNSVTEIVYEVLSRQQ